MVIVRATERAGTGEGGGGGMCFCVDAFTSLQVIKHTFGLSFLFFLLFLSKRVTDGTLSHQSR